MGESRVLAVAIVIAAVGVMALGALSACSVDAADLTGDAQPGPVRPEAVERSTTPSLATSPERAPSLSESPVAPAPTAEPPQTFLIRRGDQVLGVSADVKAAEGDERSLDSVADQTGVRAALDLEPSNTATSGEGLVLVTGDIRSVDFHNGFEYEFGGLDPIVVTDGQYQAGAVGERGYVEILVDDVVYGDVTGDGYDDALVVIRQAQNHATATSSAHLYAVTDGVLQLWGTAWTDYGSVITDVSVSDGHVVTEQKDQSHRGISTTTWAALEAGAGLRQIERSGRREFVDMRGHGDNIVTEIPMAPGAVRARIAVDQFGSHQAVAFHAEPGWTMTLSPATGAGVYLRVREATGTLVGDLGAGESVQLRRPGRHLAEIYFDATATGETTFDLDISDQRTLRAPTWVPRSEVSINDDHARREVNANWPEFTWAAGEVDLDHVNATIRAFVHERKQEHALSVQTCTDNQRSIFDLTYRMALVSYDLVSIDFGEFVCLCEDGDSFRNYQLTIDLTTGEVLTLDDIVSVGNPEARADLRRAWIDRVLAEFSWDDQLTAQTLAFDRFSSLSIGPHGLVLGAFVEPQPGAPYEMRMLIGFEKLEGVINPAIATRAASGAAVLLPEIDGCGC